MFKSFVPGREPFRPGYHKVTKILDPTVLEIDDTWFVRVKGVSEDSLLPHDKLSTWLSVGNYIKIMPYYRLQDASIVSDIWLGSIFINGSFSNYDKEAQSA